MTGSPAAGARRLAGLALLLLVAAAVALQRSATRSWASARPADGSMLLLSPIGLRQVGPGATTQECRWWPRLGSESLCAAVPGQEAALARLRRAYPLVVIAMWTAVAVLFLAVLRIPRRAPWLAPVAGVVASASAAAAAVSLGRGGQALAAVDGAIRFTEGGFMAAAGAAVALAVASGLLHAARRGDAP